MSTELKLKSAGPVSSKPAVSTKQTDVSVIIVNYNVKPLLKICLESIRAAAGDLKVQVIVVDNRSTDGSAEMVKNHFPEHTMICNDTNQGFSKANNLGLEHADGRYILLLNPDTVLQSDVLKEMTDFMDDHVDVGMSTCRLVTEDGSLDLACRRSFPSLWDGFCRASGLSRLMPNSRLFSRYNLTYLDENETCEVEAVNGAFMFVRRSALEKVGQLDNDYFMYIEDLDWCYRFREAGFVIVYHPKVTTLHLKGQSGKQQSPAMINHLFESTKMFYRKHYFPRSGFVHRMMILWALDLWKSVTLLKNSFRRNKQTRP